MVNLTTRLPIHHSHTKPTLGRATASVGVCTGQTPSLVYTHTHAHISRGSRQWPEQGTSHHCDPYNTNSWELMFYSSPCCLQNKFGCTPTLPDSHWWQMVTESIDLHCNPSPLPLATSDPSPDPC